MGGRHGCEGSRGEGSGSQFAITNDGTADLGSSCNEAVFGTELSGEVENDPQASVVVER